MATVYLGLGSNQGDRGGNIEEALRLLGEKGVKVIKKSSIIETDPVGG
ncbi:MAG: 2-amino-4-hydroxy-6-hydroxymethyldihydropteridine diphosphokinase, partial [Candidatus Omnitrophica bacterium]|nr:2-amino-4-hydroxy-6-hydroxymethyldihydropteridine diphosphokinase [Candidatus Omnitrophota bacterium]